MFPLNVPSWSLVYELVVNFLYAVFIRWLHPGALMAVMFVSAAVMIPGVWIAGGADLGPALIDAPVALARVVFSFAAGVLLYRLRRPVRIDPLIVIVAVTVLLFLPVDRDWRPAFDLACITLVFPFSIAALLGAERTTEHRERAFAFLGDASYGLYAVLYPLIWLVHGAAKKVGFDSVIVGLFLIAALVIVCAGAERILDRPIRAWLRKRWVIFANTPVKA